MIARTTLVVAGAAALVALTAGQALAVGPADRRSPRTDDALLARSQALNELYGGKAVLHGMTREAYRALATRSRALNERYGASIGGRSTAEPRVDRASSTSGGLQWRDFLIGAAAGAGALLLVAGLALGARVVRRSLTAPGVSS